MYRNKYTFAKRSLLRFFDAVPPARRLKGLTFPFKLSSFRKRLQKRRDEVAAACANTGRSPLFDLLEIETINRCNGECGFCPVNKHLDPRPAKRMTDEMFASIIEQLRDLEYSGSVFLYSNNESLLDTRIVDFAALAKSRLDKALVRISSNGLLLTPERYRSIIDNLDELYVNNYSVDFTWAPHILETMEVAKSRPEWWSKTFFVMRYQKETMTSRGGQAPNKQDLKPAATLPVGCMFPSRQMVVRPDGKLSLCCNDALGTVTLGDLAEQSLEEAWYGEKREQAMQSILAGRDGYALCRACDTLCD
ncbi:MAG: SPASM domain-containing protein [Planctomycetaceae bacterium]|nr:SPASM domain-containing protein [Planctomycetaceae bacterium]